MKRTHLDLFSGIGGFALACRWLGIETVGFAEIDDYASRVLAKNFPGVTNYGDIRNVPAIDDVWLFTGGFPCQPFSVAGKRAGATDDRALWPEMAGVIERVQPRWILAENVPGIIRMELDNVLADLERLDYTAWPVVIPACAVDAPHRRERVWIVAYAAGIRCNGHSANTGSIRQSDGRESGSGSQWGSTEKPTRSSEDVSYGHSAGLAQRQGVTGDDGTQQPPAIGACRWQPEPGICRVANGIPNRVDRLRGLGNAIVPQVAYQIIKMMIEVEHGKE